jgi:hypothetical protein
LLDVRDGKVEGEFEWPASLVVRARSSPPERERQPGDAEPITLVER